MNDAAEFILAQFSGLGYASVFFGIILEGLGLPIPGEVVLLLTGHMVSTGALSFTPAILVAAASAVLSDSAWYFAGRRGSTRVIALYCRFSFGGESCRDSAERTLRKFGPSSLIYARFIPGFRTVSAPMAGMSGMPYRSFLLYDGIGALLWAIVGITSGVLFARETAGLASWIENSGQPLLYLAATAGIAFALFGLWMSRRSGRVAADTGACNSSQTSNTKQLSAEARLGQGITNGCSPPDDL